MARTIWKYPLKTAATQTVSIPAGFPLSVQIQHGKPVLWAEVTPEAEDYTFTVDFVGTGADAVPKFGRFLGTLQFAGGDIIAHVYVTKESRE